MMCATSAPGLRLSGIVPGRQQSGEFASNREYIRAVIADLLADLPAAVRAPLADPPVTEKKLLELGADWPSLPPAEAELAEGVRLFVITWDPLETRPPRPPAFAAVNTGPLELAVYLPCWSLAALAAGRGTTMAAVLAAAAASVVTTGAAHRDVLLSGDYPNLVTRGEAPDLVGDLDAGLTAAIGLPRLIAVSPPQWDEIGLGVIQDVVQHAFGIVDLDRSPVELSARRPQPGCPACAGRRFNFPADLAESRDEMCLVHRGEAEGVIKRRLARAEVSNPAGWHAIVDASQRRELPHLPNGLATKLTGAGQAIDVIPDADLLGERARLVVEAARWFEGRPDDLGSALGADDDFLLGLPDWLISLPLELGRAGLGAEAAMVGDALGRVDPDQRHVYEADVAVALADAGQADQARERAAAIVARWPDKFWVRVNAGDALAALGDTAGAEAHFRAAADMADASVDHFERGQVMQRIADLRGERTPRAAADGREPGPRPVPPASIARRQRRKPPSRAKRKR